MPNWDSPPFLQTAFIAQPFMALAKLNNQTVQASWEQSLPGRCVAGVLNGFVAPLRRVFENTAVPGILFGLHVVCLFAVLFLTAFAETGLIAKAVLASFVLLCLRALVQRFQFKWTIIDSLVALFFLSALVSTFFSSYVHTSLVGMAKFSIFFMGYLSFRNVIGEKPGVLKLFLATLLFLGFAESMIGLYQYIHHIQPLATWQDPSVNPEDQLTRIFGTLKPSNPNLLAGFLIPGLASGLALGLSALSRCRWIAAIVSLGASVPILGALVLTGSRGGYLAILLMAIIVFLIIGHMLWHQAELKNHHRLKALWIIVLIGSVLGLIGGMAVLPSIRNRFLSIFAMRHDSSNSYRLNVWASTWRLIKDNWLFGIGPGNSTFKQVYGLYMVPGYNALSAYSIFLEMWAEQGIIGLGIFLGLIGVTKLRMFLTVYGTFSLNRKLLVCMLWTGIIGAVVYGLFDTIWYRPSVNLLFWLLVAGFSVASEAVALPALD